MKKISVQNENIKYLFWALLDEIYFKLFKTPNHFCSCQMLDAMCARGIELKRFEEEEIKKMEIK